MGELSRTSLADSAAPPAAMGKYAAVARLGNGGMADVFLAVARGPVGFNKLVVVKRLRNGEESSNVRMFLDEARLCARLSHPNIVNTYEVGDSQGKHFIAMEYLEGQPLQSLLKWLRAHERGLSEPLAAYIAVQALKALHYAHELCDYDGSPLHVVHRDVSPHNVMLTYGGEVKLLDFGIAKAAMNSTHTETGVLKGKVRYMAPEQVSEKCVDRRADLYAFGIVVWEMLAGRPLYSGDSISILTQIASQTPPLVTSVKPEVSPELDAIVQRALRTDPQERYQTAEEMRLDIERYLRGKDGASDSDLARLMGEAFGEVRETVRERIKTFIALLPEPRNQPAGTPSGDGATDTLPPLLNGEDSASTQKPRVPSHTASAVTTGSVPPEPARRGVSRVVAGAVVVAALGVVGMLALRGRHEASSPGVLAGTESSAAVRATTTVPAPAPSTGLVHVATDPPGALIEQNGKPIDHTPADLRLDIGPQTLLVTLPGYEVEQLAVNVKAGTVIDQIIQLRPKPAGAPVAVAPSSPSRVPRSWPSPRGRSRSPATPSSPSPVAASPASAAPSAPPPKIRVLDDSDSP